MGYEVAISASDAQVQKVHLRKDVSRNAGGAPAYMVLSPLSPPRLWRTIADDVANSFERAVEGQTPTMATIAHGCGAAADAITRIRDQLIEPNLSLDARIGLLMTSADVVHVALTEGVRLYRARGGVPERLFAKAQRPPGIAGNKLFTASERTEAGDLFVLGTRDAFTVRSIGNLAAVLARSARAPVAELCEAVISPCRESGIGAAAIVLRAA